MSQIRVSSEAAQVPEIASEPDNTTGMPPRTAIIWHEWTQKRAQQQREIPTPSPVADGQELVAVPPIAAAKLALLYGHARAGDHAAMTNKTFWIAAQNHAAMTAFRYSTCNKKRSTM